MIALRLQVPPRKKAILLAFFLTRLRYLDTLPHAFRSVGGTKPTD